jgi:hypothetical protein
VLFLKQYRHFIKLSKKGHRFRVSWSERNPQLHDNSRDTGFDPHYTYHPAWAARILAKTKPARHVDISSILSFSTIVSAFVPTDFYDYRPAHITLSDLISRKADLTALQFSDNSIESLSCMHTIEHIGLGRYGDTIDPDGDIKAMSELSRVIARGGNLLFVTPIGKPRIQFNAHRIYSYRQIIDYFPDLKLKEFSLLADDGGGDGLIINASETQADSQEYGCGCFWFTKV